MRDLRTLDSHSLDSLISLDRIDLDSFKDLDAPSVSGGVPTFNDETYVIGGQRGSVAYVIGGDRGKVDFEDLV